MVPYTIIVQTGPWTEQIDTMLARIAYVDSFLDRLADEEVLPILARHYDASGIKQNSPQASLFGGSRGNLKAAITKRGAAGNVIRKSPGQLVVGVSYEQIPYARWVIEGRGPVYPKNKKALHWVDENGKDHFAKRVGPAPAHPIYFLTLSEVDEIGNALAKMLGERFE